MKICWDNLSDTKFLSNGCFRRKGTTYVERYKCKCCGDVYLTVKKKQSNFCSPSCVHTGVNNGYYGHRDIVFDKKELKELYWNKGKSIVEIAKIFNCGKSTIYRRLKEFNIKIRTASERQSLTNSKLWLTGKRSLNSIGKCSLYETPYGKIVKMRSQWEVKVADYLTHTGDKWLYEPHILDLGDGVLYIPDFYLPDKDEYIEVKGWKSPNSMRKFNLAKSKYNVLLWDGNKLKKMGII